MRCENFSGKAKKVVLGLSVAWKGELQSAAHFYEHKLTSESRELRVEMCARTATVGPAKCPVPQSYCHFNTLTTWLLNCLNARSRGLTFRHRASCI